MSDAAFSAVEVEAGTTAPDLYDPATRARLSGAAFRGFVAVAEQLNLTNYERRRLLGDLAESTYHKWRSAEAPQLSVDLLERISLVLGIVKGLRLLFADDATALRWLRATNTDVPFAGESPLVTMLRGSINELYGVRRYIDAWRGA